MQLRMSGTGLYWPPNIESTLHRPTYFLHSPWLNEGVQLAGCWVDIGESAIPTHHTTVGSIQGNSKDLFQ